MASANFAATKYTIGVFALQLLQRRNGLHEKAGRRRHALEESYKNQMFERDYDETKIWINEKLKAASDYEGYLVRICCVSFMQVHVRMVQNTLQLVSKSSSFGMFTAN